MTLQEALATGKRLRLVSIDDEFLTFDEISESYGLAKEDVLATTWEVEAEATLSLTEQALADAWNTARAGSLNVKPAGTSEFYKKFLSQLKSLAS